MKTSHVLPVFFLSISATFAGQTIINETFAALPEPSDWKTLGSVTVDGGKLNLIASGDEAGFVNSGIQRVDPMSGLNFIRQPVKIEISKLALGGEALPEKQAFIILLATDLASETQATAYLRLCVDGHGQMSLAASAGEPGEGRSLETLASVPVAFPISGIELDLKPEGYRITYKDAAGSQEREGTWEGKIDPSTWKDIDPMLVLKAVRRPAEGTCEVSLGGFKVTAE